MTLSNYFDFKEWKLKSDRNLVVQNIYVHKLIASSIIRENGRVLDLDSENY